MLMLVPGMIVSFSGVELRCDEEDVPVLARVLARSGFDFSVRSDDSADEAVRQQVRLQEAAIREARGG